MRFAFLIEPPFNFRAPSGEVTGCDVELARIILTMCGVEQFDAVETEFAQLLPGVAQGKWRMTTGLFATTERRRTASFSRPIWALPDGLLVEKENPKHLTGYRSIADNSKLRLAVVRDQVQHRSALAFGVRTDRIMVFDTYDQAANAVRDGIADAYASVARSHAGYLAQQSNDTFSIVPISLTEKAPEFGCFGFAVTDDSLRNSVDVALNDYIGTPRHRALMKKFGFDDGEVDLVANL